MTQSLRNKWIETGLKKVDLRKVNHVSKKIKKPEKPKSGRKVFTMEEVELALSILHSSKRFFVFMCPLGLNPDLQTVFE